MILEIKFLDGKTTHITKYDNRLKWSEVQPGEDEPLITTIARDFARDYGGYLLFELVSDHGKILKKDALWLR